MDRKQILDFINRNPIFALGTSEDGQPRVRYMMTSIADDRGIFFSTGRAKKVAAQLAVHPAAELCYYEHDSQTQVRIEARVQEAEESSLKEEIVEKFPFLRPWLEEAGIDAMATYRLEGAKATVIVSSGPDEKREIVKL